MSTESVGSRRELVAKIIVFTLPTRQNSFVASASTVCRPIGHYLLTWCKFLNAKIQNVAKRCRCCGVFSDRFIANLPPTAQVKGFENRSVFDEVILHPSGGIAIRRVCMLVGLLVR